MVTRNSKNQHNKGQPMAKTTSKQFTVQACSRTLVTLEITAVSLSDAIQKANGMKEDAFVSVKGETLDGDFWITGVYESGNSLEAEQ